MGPATYPGGKDTGTMFTIHWWLLIWDPWSPSNNLSGSDSIGLTERKQHEVIRLAHLSQY